MKFRGAGSGQFVRLNGHVPQYGIKHQFNGHDFDVLQILQSLQVIEALKTSMIYSKYTIPIYIEENRTTDKQRRLEREERYTLEISYYFKKQ